MTSKETKKNKVRKKGNESDTEKYLILHNDDYHSFDYVIQALMDICQHNYEQAAQCTLITHNKGKCDVKKGNKGELEPLKEALTEKELTATID